MTHPRGLTPETARAPPLSQRIPWKGPPTQSVKKNSQNTSKCQESVADQRFLILEISHHQENLLLRLILQLLYLKLNNPYNEGKIVTDETKVLLKKERTNIYIQTDKAVYKPGQTVKFRVVSLKEDFLPNNIQLLLIQIQDPDRNRIAQWQNVTLQQGISEFSFPLSIEPQLGEYSIHLKDNVHPFMVEKYVLPKFEVFLHLPDHVSTGQTHFQFQVHGRYTFGKPVQGVYSSELCQKAQHNYYYWRYRDEKNICESFTGTAGTKLSEKGNWYETSPEELSETLSIEQVHSKSNNFLKLQSPKNVIPCSVREVMVEYVLRVNKRSEDNLFLYYLVVSKGTLHDFGSEKILLKNKTAPRGEISIRLPLSVSPLLQVLAYTMLPNGEIVADSTEIKVAKSFGNKVYNLFPTRHSKEYDYRIRDPENHCFQWFHHFPRNKEDVYSLFEATQIKIVTNSEIKTQVNCDYTTFPPRTTTVAEGESPPIGNLQFSQVFGESVPGSIPEEEEEAKKIRKYFPETWIFEMAGVGKEGSVNLSYSAPDTITDWSVGSFCVGPNGFGIAPTTSLRTFKPLFVEMSLPYSVIRGETFTLKASLFNYLKQCVKVQAFLESSSELQEEPCVGCDYSRSLCADESATVSWKLKAIKLGEVNITVRTEALHTQEMHNNQTVYVPNQGKVDTVIRPLLVQPEGILEEKSHSSMLCGKGIDHFKKETSSLTVPENIVKDSGRGYVIIRGDLMGSALQNLDRLLQMPCGCGEQNMVLFVPNIFILEYLEKTQQLTDAIKEKATNFLTKGYQRQLTYKRHSGSYSAFGKSDPEGNTWLTAFVVRSFSKAKQHIYINADDLQHSIDWLKKNQKPDGSFKSKGRLLNNAMKGGVEDEITLSAYVTIALLDAGLSIEDPVMQNAMSFLRNAVPDASKVYTQALLAYAFTLSNETQLRQRMLGNLEESAVRRAGQMHWERKSLPPSKDSYWYRAPSVEVELTSYVLLAYVSGLTVQESEQAKSLEMVNWLSKQQNPSGGFSSTQDTVVALQALAKYAERIFSDQGTVAVTVSDQMGFKEQVHVDQANRLLLQTVSLPQIPGEYAVTTAGVGCVFIQMVVRYNVPPPKSDAAFEIRLETNPKECTNQLFTSFEIHIHTKYTGPRESSNMALITVKMLSGYTPVESSIKSLEEKKLIQRSEVQSDLVTLYLNELKQDTVHLSFTVEMINQVKNLKPAVISVYDFYETAEKAFAEYNAPCRSGDKVEDSR
ncbi:alpha-2-macroglobulin [Bombina bombina]|uniref:alpha-2-macroglobulin n=1 Tax=Bombina bombina TaxID=8345 RepID=UPI00235AFA68|nr:alpha-2-macroglobulin [Bombina bombina]